MIESELQQLVDQAKQGLRVLLFPPGGWTLPILMVTGAIVLALTVSPLQSLIAPDLTVDQRIIVHFASMFFGVIGCAVPGLLIMSGWKMFSNFVRGYFLLAGFVNLLQIVACLLIPRSNYLPPVVIALTFAGFGYYIAKTHSFWMLCEYMYLLKRKKPDTESLR